jgi:hypothetical protein
MSRGDSSVLNRLSNISAQMATLTKFDNVPLAPPDAILGISQNKKKTNANLGLTEDFKADKSPEVHDIRVFI